MTQSPNSSITTNGVCVQAKAHYLAEESDPDAPFFLFVYRISISNESDQVIKLMSRHWIIRDAYNEREDVQGSGVVGDFPVLAPGESYEYTSTCPLRTRWGTMEGSYQFEVCDSGEPFEVAIGRFFLVPTSKVTELSTEG
jgi:ApaG protein